jgi:predicted ester cyclase
VKGFDSEFVDLDHYIRVITDRIWEGRRLDDIYRYYSAGCAVETPASVSVGTAPVVDGTRATLLAFPDRRLLAEDVIASGDDVGGYLSSHRIFSPMTHAGPGAFGPATGRPVFARTIADCVCVGNRIVHEWLVRDQAAIARQLGLHERDLAQRWLDERGGFKKPPMPPAPAPYVPWVDTQTLAQAYAQGFQQLAHTGANGAAAQIAATHHPHVITCLPAAQAAVGVPALVQFWAGLWGALAPQQLAIEHLVLQQRPGRAPALAMRWRAQTLHVQDGRYGPATGRAVEVLGITHAEFEGDRVVREWVLIDDVALWMQVLVATSPRAA